MVRIMEPPTSHAEAGATPATPEELFHRLEALSIPVSTVEHPPVFTVEEAKASRGKIAGRHTKNLFLRNKKGRMWLVVCPEDRQVDLRSLASKLGAGRLSFGSPERLMTFLGVIPGSVTPFAAVNDLGGDVCVVLDRELLAHAVLNFHPLTNTKTTSITPNDLLRFLASEHHAPEICDLEGDDRGLGRPSPAPTSGPSR